MNRERESLKQSVAEINAMVESVKQSQINIQQIEEITETIKANMSDLSFESKRMALESLELKVFLDSEVIRIRGSVPINPLSVASTLLK